MFLLLFGFNQLCFFVNTQSLKPNLKNYQNSKKRKVLPDKDYFGRGTQRNILVCCIKYYDAQLHQSFSVKFNLHLTWLKNTFSHLNSSLVSEISII